MVAPDDRASAQRDTIEDQFDAWRNGQPSAFDALFTQLYQQMRALAHGQVLRARPGDTLRTTAVVNEAWLRLSENPELDATSREHFLSLAARAMRFVLIDHARERLAEKRGGGAVLLALDDAGGLASSEPGAAEILDIDRALQRLAALSQRQARVFELRTFGGLTIDEIVEATGIPRGTVKRDWQNAKLYVAHQLSLPAPSGDPA